MTDDDRRYWEAASLAALTGLLASPSSVNLQKAVEGSCVIASMMLAERNKRLGPKEVVFDAVVEVFVRKESQ